MTPAPPPPPSPPPPPPPSGGNFARWLGEAWHQLLATLPFLKDFIMKMTTFAAESSWKRMVLLGIVVFTAMGIIGSILEVDHTEVVSAGLDKPIDIQVHTDRDSIRIQPSIDGKPAKTIVVPLPHSMTQSGGSDGAAAKGTVDIDKDALQFERNGKHVVIDSHGVRVLSSKEAQAANAKSGDSPAMTPPATPGPAPARGASPAPPASPALTAQAEEEQAEEARRAATAEEERATVEEEVKSAIEDSRDEINDAIGQAVAARQKVTVHHRESLAFWDIFQVLVIISFAYMIAIKVASTKTQRADAMVKSASMTAERESLQRQVVEARMQMMQAQVEPHFLFNTLASVDYLIETDPKRASTMQKNLIQYLRAALPQMREASTNLGREVDLVRAYLEILKVRMEERLRVSFTVPEGLRSADFPPMMLQSLVENAIKHGLEPKTEGGDLLLAAEIIDGDLYVSVADTGLGFSPDGAGTSGGGLGLTNIRDRLALLYGTRGRFVVETNEPSGTRVTIIIPYQPMGKRSPPKPGGNPP